MFPEIIEITVITPDDAQSVDNQWLLNGTEVVDYIRRVAEKNDAICVMEPEYFIEGEPTQLLKIKISNVDAPLMKSMTSAQHILWPVCKQAHWYLMIISKSEDDNEMTIRCLDGFNTEGIHNILFTNMKDFLQEVFAKKNKIYNFKYKSVSIRKQNNAKDCGVVVCHYAENFCQAASVSSFDEHCAQEAQVEPMRYLSARKRVIRSQSAPEGQHIRKKPR